MHTNDRKNKTLYVDTVAEMLALTGAPDGTHVDTARYSTSHTVGDGSGGEYVYDADSTATIDGGFVLPGPGGTLSFSGTTFNGNAGAGGRWLLKDQTVANVMQFGAVGDGTADDTAAIQAAINAGNSRRATVTLSSVGTYRITSGLVVPSGWNAIKVDSPTQAISISSISAAKGAVLYDGDSGATIVSVRKQDGSLYSLFSGLAVINKTPSVATGCTGIWFRDETQSGAAYRVFAHRLLVANCEYGFRWGNEAGGDTASATNIDENRYHGLSTWRCGVAFLFDCSASDDNTFHDVFIEGAYSDAVSGYTTPEKVYVRRSGTSNSYQNWFVNASDVATDGSAVRVESGDGVYRNFNMESADSTIRMLTLLSASMRGSIELSNWKAPISSASPSFRDSSGIAMSLNAKQSIYMLNCTIDGNVSTATPVTATNTIFADVAGTQYGFVQQNTSQDVVQIATRHITSTDAYASAEAKTKILKLEDFQKGWAVEKSRFYQGFLTDNTFESYCRFAIANDTTVAGKISYIISGPATSNAARFCERGEFFFTAVADSSGTIVSNITKGTSSQSVDGGTLTVDAQFVNDEAGDTVTIQLRQDNSLGFSLLGYGKVELSTINLGGQPSMDADTIQWINF